MSLLSEQTSGDGRRRWIWIAAFALAGTLTALTFIFLQKPIYEVHSTIEVGGECGAGRAADSSEAFLDTQTQLLQTSSMQAAAAQRAGIDESLLRPEVGREGQSRLINIVARSIDSRQAAVDPFRQL